MNATDIVAYAFQAELLCPGCTIVKLPTSDGEEFDGWTLARGVRMSAEENLDEIATAFGIDRQDESSFDSDHFPKVVFADQITEGDTCNECGGELS